MATVSSPVELPAASRRSTYQRSESDNDIRNPKWIPVLRKTEIDIPHSPASNEKELSPFSTSNFSPMPTFAPELPQPRSKPASLHSYSKSESAPQSVELEAASPPPPVPLPPLPPLPQQTSRQMNFELPATRPQSRYFEQNHTPTASADVTSNSTDTETSADVGRSDSAAGTSSTSEETSHVQVPSTVKEETPSLYPRSTRSSYSSTKKYSIAPPTSKFSRKAVPPLPSRVASLVQPPPDHALNVPSSKTTPVHSRNQTPTSSPRMTAVQTQAPALSSSRSTASKKAPSLQPTPSTTSLASHSSSENSAIIAMHSSIDDTHRPPSQKARKSTQSVKSQHTQRDRKDSNLPLPPTMPTFDMSRESMAPSMVFSTQPPTPMLEKPQATVLAPQTRPAPSTGVSSFMTANDTVIFRRFDEVHVQLLLCLQDEITQLERDLMRLESASMTRNDRDVERGRVMRELRKVVAEYGKLYPHIYLSGGRPVLSLNGKADRYQITSFHHGAKCNRTKHQKGQHRVYENGFKDPPRVVVAYPQLETSLSGWTRVRICQV